MKKTFYYALTMIIIIILLPLLIVKGCSVQNEPSLPNPTGKDIMIKVYFVSDNEVKNVPLEEYVKEVVAAEMPADFEIEALKAQAVAARSYAYGRMLKLYGSKENNHQGADVCTDSGHCQAWVSKENAKKNWSIFSASKNWNKIERAVKETEGIILVYDTKVINPLFHSNSGGRTENAEEVWDGVQVPYLRSVFSYGEDSCSEYKTTVEIPVTDFIQKLKGKYPDSQVDEEDILQDIEFLGYTTGNRVKTIRIGSVTMKGTEFRQLFSLRSANFSIECDDNSLIKITTVGNGHGVGMSQWGANFLAKTGGGYQEILKYYYEGVKLNVLNKKTK
ncbi:MAG: stage II sporulation protein D [Clostridia bacterium]|nr:stage II sporulation protein D [Clostridia bacterium]